MNGRTHPQSSAPLFFCVANTGLGVHQGSPSKRNTNPYPVTRLIMETARESVAAKAQGFQRSHPPEKPASQVSMPVFHTAPSRPSPQLRESEAATPPPARRERSDVD